MFNVKLVDIGNSGEFVEYTTPLETLTEVEHLVTGDISNVLDTDDISLVYDDDLIYEVYSNGCSIGMVAIESL